MKDLPLPGAMQSSAGTELASPSDGNACVLFEKPHEYQYMDPVDELAMLHYAEPWQGNNPLTTMQVDVDVGVACACAGSTPKDLAE